MNQDEKNNITKEGTKLLCNIAHSHPMVCLFYDLKAKTQTTLLKRAMVWQTIPHERPTLRAYPFARLPTFS